MKLERPPADIEDLLDDLNSFYLTDIKILPRYYVPKVRLDFEHYFIIITLSDFPGILIRLKQKREK